MGKYGITIKVAFALLLILGIILTSKVSFTEPQAPNVKALKVGMLLPLSGEYASGGEDNRQGIEAALAVSKSVVPLEIIYSNSKNNFATTSGINEFRKLTKSDKVLAVGPEIVEGVKFIEMNTDMPSLRKIVAEK